MHACRCCLLVLATLLTASLICAEPAAPLSALAKMPVKEVTVFKDGHVLVLHEGAMPTDEAGNVLMDYLPTPLLGAFWPYSAEKNAKLTAVVAGRRRVRVDRTALDIRSLLESNVGRGVIINEFGGPRYEAVIIGTPARTGDEQEATNAPNSEPPLPQKGDIILLKTADGVKAIPFTRIQDVTFKDPLVEKASSEEYRNLLTLKLDWGAQKPAKNANVGLVYLQKGLRWIPGYRITLDGKGNATVKLQGTLVNDLADLNDVTAHLAIGATSFAFDDMVDPISLQQAVAQVERAYYQGRTREALSNAVASQVADYSDNGRNPGQGGGELGPEIAGSKRAEELFLFTVKHITLKKGERMVFPIAEYELKYQDVFLLDLPYMPPQDVYRNMGMERQSQIARLLAAPKVIHNIRLNNAGQYPLTTAPALIFRDDRLLTQGMMTYTPVGGVMNLPVMPALDVQMEKHEKETKRTYNAVTWNGDQYAKIELSGIITLTNHREQGVDLEVTRYVLGNVDTADAGGKIERGNVLEDTAYLTDTDLPDWWSWYSWPYWWPHFNGMGRVTWKLHLDPDKSATLNYAWDYYWR